MWTKKKLENAKKATVIAAVVCGISVSALVATNANSSLELDNKADLGSQQSASEIIETAHTELPPNFDAHEYIKQNGIDKNEEFPLEFEIIY